MGQFGVSRPTLREAFRILEAEDLISVKRGSRGGARVTQPSLSVAARYVGLLLQVQGTTIADVYEARMVLEPACARLLARRRTKQDLADLTSCIEDMAPEPALWSSRAARFHELIMQRSGSKKLAALVEKRDGAGAERHWRAHMEAAGQRLLREDLQSRSVVDLFS